jgi:hypothetical protein
MEVSRPLPALTPEICATWIKQRAGATRADQSIMAGPDHYQDEELT